MVLARKDRHLANCRFSLTGQLAGMAGKVPGKVLGKIGVLLNDLERNSSGGNEEEQNEDVESVMAKKSSGWWKKELKNVRAHALADVILFSE